MYLRRPILTVHAAHFPFAAAPVRFIKNVAGEGQPRSEYLFVHFPAAAQPDTAYWDGNDFILLGRVKADQLLNRSAYEFFSGARHGSQPEGSGEEEQGWTNDARRAVPVFEYQHMTGQDHTFYNAGLKRYILPNYGFVNPKTHKPVAWHGLQQDQKASVSRVSPFILSH